MDTIVVKINRSILMLNKSVIKMISYVVNIIKRVLAAGRKFYKWLTKRRKLFAKLRKDKNG